MEGKPEKAYKIVEIKDGRLTSLIAFGKAKLEYKPGRITKAHDWSLENGFGIFCFDNEKTAKEWIKMCENAELWEVEGIGRMKLPEYMGDWVALRKGEIKTSLKLRLPARTVMYQAVLLVKRIWRVSDYLIDKLGDKNYE